MAPSRSAVIGLYRGLLKEGVKLKDYNMRVYVSRRTKEDFHKELSSEAAESLYEQGMTDFGVCTAPPYGTQHQRQRQQHHRC